MATQKRRLKIPIFEMTIEKIESVTVSRRYERSVITRPSGETRDDDKPLNGVGRLDRKDGNGNAAHRNELVQKSMEDENEIS